MYEPSDVMRDRAASRSPKARSFPVEKWSLPLHMLGSVL
jgi:hypothetical protein